MRQRRNDLFTDRMLNMGWYAGISATAAVHNIVNFEETKLKNISSLLIDGNPIEIPKQVRSIVVMNLLTYGGTNCWGTKPEPVIEPSFNDGILEVVAMYIHTPFHVLHAFSPLTLQLKDWCCASWCNNNRSLRGHTIGTRQGGHVHQSQTDPCTGTPSYLKLINTQTHKSVLLMFFSMCKIDGEPMELMPCRTTISFYNQARMLMSTQTDKERAAKAKTGQ